MSKFGFYTDVHLTNRHIRIDDVAETAINKLRECYSFAEKNNFDFMVCGGDVFNTHTVISLNIFIGLIEVMYSFGKPTYFIVGNHDIYGNSFNSYKISPLNFIASAIPNLFIPIFDAIELDDVILYGCNTFNNLQYCIDHIPVNDKKFQVLVDHHMLYDKNIPNAQVIHLNDVGSNNADLILSGHVHMGYKLQKIGSTSYFNPGALLRTSYDLRNLEVKMGVIENEGKNFKIDLFFPKKVDGKLIFKENIFSGIEKIAQMELKPQKDGAIDSLKHFLELKESSLSVFDLLERIAIENNKDPKIMGFINKFKLSGRIN